MNLWAAFLLGALCGGLAVAAVVLVVSACMLSGMRSRDAEREAQAERSGVLEPS